jgi:hypothetical protein
VEKQDARSIDDDQTSIWPGDLQSSFLEGMKICGMFALICGASAQEPRKTSEP